MPRHARKRSEFNVYHIFARGAGKQIIFEDNRDRRAYLDALAKHAAEAHASIYAWCLMDNHVHLLVKTDASSPSAMMQRLNAHYATIFNKRHERVGPLFQGRFGSEPVDSDRYLMTVVRYIHKNPEAAGLSKMADYPWSSYREFIGLPRIANTAFVLSVFGGVENFIQFHTEDDPSAPCIDEGRQRSVLDSDAARLAASKALGAIQAGNVKGLPRSERNEAIAQLRNANLSIRQIERLTGISRTVIARVPYSKQ